MADSRVETLHEQKPEEIIEMKTFKSNIKTERERKFVLIERVSLKSSVLAIILVAGEREFISKTTFHLKEQ